MAGRTDAHADLIAATQAPRLCPILLAEIGYGSGAERAWTGNGTLIWDGVEFYGVGTLGKVSAVSETTEFQANGMAFTLDGVPAARLQQAIGDFRYGLPAKLWLAVLDEQTGTMIGEPYPLADNITDSIAIDDAGETCSITVRTESPAITLDAALNWRYTNQDQQRRHPGDKGFEYVPSLVDKTITFGKS
ncbi:hypothetical protein [Magnetospirillum aberrantis]|uniref:DUF2163 domain-containing protein n=1 Tax=Magnetospirillum aberrantis SpK TaxID=908842 RepID=A0A7C9UYP7_9PROT|nr:hypothetical protein [Magnetospirillum aberrantis]NFV79991.1 hypothetical protein [Magnetospirillum aberrantis SpK]